MKNGKWNLGALLVAGMLALPAGPAHALDPTTANNLATNFLAQLARPNGVWSVPHCQGGELVVALWNMTANSNLLVDAFERDATLLAGAQQKAAALGLLGQKIYVYQKRALTNMPYADNFVDLVTITGLTNADLAAVSYAEIERVLNPGGKAWVGKALSEGGCLSGRALTNWIAAGIGTNGRSSAVVTNDGLGLWALITKSTQLLPGTDEWPGDGDGASPTWDAGTVKKNASHNRYSSDTAGTPFLPQWNARPYADHVNDGGNSGRENWQACVRVHGVSGGRMYRSVTKIENGAVNLYLSASCFFNGQILWEKKFQTDILACPQRLPVVISSTPDYFVFLDMYETNHSSGQIHILDGASGVESKTLTAASFPTNFGAPQYMLVDQNILYAFGTTNGVVHLAKYDLANRAAPIAYCVPVPTSLGLTNGSQLVRDMPALADGNIYLINTGTVYCCSAANGRCLWGPQAGTNVADAGCNHLVASKWGVCFFQGSPLQKNSPATFFAATNGAILWQRSLAPTSQLDDYYLPTQTNFVFCGDFINCGYFTLSPKGHWGQMGPDLYISHRTACNEAPFPCYGMLVYPPRDCLCGSSIAYRMPGTSVLASQGTFNPEIEIAGGDRLEPGPAYTNWTAVVTPDAQDWPTYRGHNNRGAWSPAILPKAPQLLWQYHNPSPLWTPLFSNDIYAAEHKATSPVTAGNYVYVAGSDGQVKCLAAGTGSLVWSYATGGDIWIAPTVWNGGVYVGSGDGYVYCLEAHTGKLRWRFRAAPTERRMNDWGHLMSSWPVIGGVLVQDGFAYFASGIYHEYGAQVFKVDALTGALAWQNTQAGIFLNKTQRWGLSPIGTMTVAMKKLWVRGRDGACVGFDLDTGEAGMPPDSFPKYRVGGGGISAGADIGVLGKNYLMLGGYAVYFRDGANGFYTPAQELKLDDSGAPVYPVINWLEIKSGIKITGMGYWNDQSYCENPIQAATAICDAAIAACTSQTYAVGSRLSGGLKYNGGIAGCANGWIYAPASCGQKVITSLGWTSPALPSPAIYANPAAIDRHGNILVALRNGDVLCYASATPNLCLTSGTEFTAPAKIPMQAYAFSTHGIVARVDFYQGTTRLGVLTNAPYAFLWTNAAAGTYQITAAWHDNTGHCATSAVVSVTVTNSCAFSAAPTNGMASRGR